MELSVDCVANRCNNRHCCRQHRRPRPFSVERLCFSREVLSCFVINCPSRVTNRSIFRPIRTPNFPTPFSCVGVHDTTHTPSRQNGRHVCRSGSNNDHHHDNVCVCASWIRLQSRFHLSRCVCVINSFHWQNHCHSKQQN